MVATYEKERQNPAALTAKTSESDKVKLMWILIDVQIKRGWFGLCMAKKSKCQVVLNKGYINTSCRKKQE